MFVQSVDQNGVEQLKQQFAHVDIRLQGDQQRSLPNFLTAIAENTMDHRVFVVKVAPSDPEVSDKNPLRLGKIPVVHLPEATLPELYRGQVDAWSIPLPPGLDDAQDQEYIIVLAEVRVRTGILND